MAEALNRSFCFTQRGMTEMLKTVQDLSFPSQDASMILRCLKNEIGFTPFSEYLKRYVYLKSGMTGSYRMVSPEQYQAVIVDAFRETGTPCSMEETKTPIQTRIKSWLYQARAGRSIILLLGFGLSMSREDVNRFLLGSIHDHRLDPDDPLEAICGYCYDHGYRYAKFKQLWQIYHEYPAGADMELFMSLQPARRKASQFIARQDYQLLHSLASVDIPTNTTLMQQKISDTFFSLYRQVSDLLLTGTTPPVRQVVTKECTSVVAPSDLEKVLCASIPRDRHGNLVSELHSSLKQELAGKRFSRQHLYELLNHKTQPNRYDLITLHFLVSSFRNEHNNDPKARYLRFLRETDTILQDCGFGPLYTADPYECFILMCVLSVDPLGTYSDVLELSYRDNGEVI